MGPPDRRCIGGPWWMNTGRTVFAQLIAHLSHIDFQKCVSRYGGDSHHRSLSCGDQYLAMGFAQSTYRRGLSASWPSGCRLTAASPARFIMGTIMGTTTLMTVEQFAQMHAADT